jgi:uncharacterized protein YjbI with pentapeptide repeats
MAEEFEDQDLSGATFWGVDLSGAYFRDVNLTNVRVESALLRHVDIDALIEKVTINGVDVTAYVNERDPSYPLRAMLQPADPEGMRTTWDALRVEWVKTLERAGQLPEAMLDESVNGEWSFVQTLRHVVFAIDKWFTAPILGGAFDPRVLPNRGSDALDWPGRDRAAEPTFGEAAAAHAQRIGSVREYLAAVAESNLDQTVDVLENGQHTVRECVHVVFEETFAHNRYATRDLEILARTDADQR